MYNMAAHHYIVTAQKPTTVTACITGKNFKMLLLENCQYEK